MFCLARDLASAGRRWGHCVVTGCQGTGTAKTVEKLVNRNIRWRAFKPGVELPVEKGIGPAVNEADDRGTPHVQAELRLGRKDALCRERLPHQAFKLADCNDLHFSA